MTTLTFRSPTLEPLHPAGWARPATGAGADDFRITQRFDDPDFYWSKLDPAKAALGHRATDIGNGRCGYPLVAMHGGPSRRLRDNATALGAPSDALGLRIDCGFGITLEYWHLDRYALPDGATVQAGQVIGYVGKTGLGAVCHCHIEAKSHGIRFDPEPLMFGGSLSVQEDDDVKIKGKFLRHVQNRRAQLTIDAHLREGVVAGDDASLQIMPKGTTVYPVVVVEGRPVGTAPDKAAWYGALNWVAERGWVLGYYHSSVLPRTADQAGVALETIETVEVVREVPTGLSPREVYEAVDAVASAARAVADTYKPAS